MVYFEGAMSTFFVKKNDVKEKPWQVLDAKGQVVGRLAARISRILSGKTRTDYTPHTENGDGVIVLNASQMLMTGNKPKAKIYKYYSGYPSGQREISYEEQMKKDATYPLMHAVKGMLPKSRLGRSMLTRLRVYAGNEHPHSAQISRRSEPKAKVKKVEKAS